MIIPIIIVIVIGVAFVVASKLGSGVIAGAPYNTPPATPPVQPAYLGSQNVAGLANKTRLTKSDFYSTIVNYGKGFDWSILIPLTMGALETNYSKSCYFHNLFNITTHVNNPAQFFMYTTIPILKFKIYTGFQESVAHFWQVFKLSRYHLAFQNRHNPEQAITELIKAGYAGSMRDPLRYLTTLHFVRSYYNSRYV